jgi:hypothetical protein
MFLPISWDNIVIARHTIADNIVANRITWIDMQINCQHPTLYFYFCLYSQPGLSDNYLVNSNTPWITELVTWINSKNWTWFFIEMLHARLMYKYFSSLIKLYYLKLEIFFLINSLSWSNGTFQIYKLTSKCKHIIFSNNIFVMDL